MVLKRASMPSRPMVTLAFPVPAPVFDGLAELARKAGHPRDLYASNLLIAAYSAKHLSTGDAALDTAIASMDTRPADLAVGEACVETLRQLEIVTASLTDREKENARLRAAIEKWRLRDAERAEEIRALIAEVVELKEDRNAYERAQIALRSKLMAELEALQAERQAEKDRSATETTEAQPEPDTTYGLCRRAKAEAPASDDAPLTKSFIKIVVGYRYANTSVEQIARMMGCDVAAVRRAIEASGRRA